MKPSDEEKKGKASRGRGGKEKTKGVPVANREAGAC